MSIEIQADPVQLRKIADDINKCQIALNGHLQNSNNQVGSLMKGIWTGEAANAFNLSFQKLLKQCSESTATVGRMVKALYESADTYERNEKAVLKQASDMPKLPNNTMR